MRFGPLLTILKLVPLSPNHKDPTMKTSIQNISLAALTLTMILSVGTANAGVYSLNSDWSNSSNTNGAWSYREGNNTLPAVASWQSTLGGWATAQPGWAYSENGTNRLPFWFKSNGTETFSRDFLAGDVVVHTTDLFNGQGSSFANVQWTSPDAGSAIVSGSVWMGREIGRSVIWQLLVNGLSADSGLLSSGDAFSRATPDTFSVSVPSLAVGDTVELRFISASAAGDFVGMTLDITTTVPTPATAPIAALAMLTIARRRRTAN